MQYRKKIILILTTLTIITVFETVIKLFGSHRYNPVMIRLNPATKGPDPGMNGFLSYMKKNAQPIQL